MDNLEPNRGFTILGFAPLYHQDMLQRDETLAIVNIYILIESKFELEKVIKMRRFDTVESEREIRCLFAINRNVQPFRPSSATQDITAINKQKKRKDNQERKHSQSDRKRLVIVLHIVDQFCT